MNKKYIAALAPSTAAFDAFCAHYAVLRAVGIKHSKAQRIALDFMLQANA